jgi:plasmid stabilization system protein ParE
VKVVATDSFWAGMSRIGEFLVSAEAGHRYESLLDDFDQIIVPNLGAFPQIGKPYIGDTQQSTEALMAVAKLPRDARSNLRQYVHDDYSILYVLGPELIHIVAIRHHKESTFIP